MGDGIIYGTSHYICDGVQYSVADTLEAYSSISGGPPVFSQ